MTRGLSDEKKRGPVLYYLFAAFYVWMIVDAIRRRAEFWWYLIILFVPFGPLIYFFVVKLQDRRPGGGAIGRLTRREPSLDDLRYRAGETPSVVNKLALADALLGRGEYQEAAAIYQDMLSNDRENKEALYGHSLSLMGMQRPVQAADELHELMELDNSYRDYAAALDYGEALWQSGEHEDAVDLLRGLVGVDSRINHRIALAHYLGLSGHGDEAREQLTTALDDYQHQPAFVKRRDSRWAAQAEKMLRELR